MSSIYETDPIGGVEQDSFLNAVAVIETTLAPIELLQLGFRIENLANRVREIHWGPRTLDIDLVDVVDFASSTAELTVPHPRAHERAFVLIPLLEIDPLWKIGGITAASDFLENVAGQNVIKRSNLKLKVEQK